jgi:LacI family transcriptional regulator
MDDLTPFCGPNPDGLDHGQRGHGNRTVTRRYGPGKARRLLRCSTCAARFSERKGIPLFDARLPPDTAAAVLGHVAEGVGTRKTARLVGVRPDTVTRYLRLAGGHAGPLHEELVAFSPATAEVPFDEKWALVGRKEKNRNPGAPAGGTAGTTWPSTPSPGWSGGGRRTPPPPWSGTPAGPPAGAWCG